jgi:RNA polymerase sigma-70 factor (ECF subfamily)
MVDMPDDTTPDDMLIARAAQGDREAFDVLSARYGLRLRRAAMRVLDDPAAAEDVAQDALLRAWTKAASYRPEQAAVGTWLHRIAVNAAIDRLRATRHSSEIPEDLADAGPSAELALAGRQQHALLREAIASLPERQRAAITLTYGEGWSGQRAADALRVSARALEGLLHRSRKALRAYIEERET